MVVADPVVAKGGKLIIRRMTTVEIVGIIGSNIDKFGHEDLEVPLPYFDLKCWGDGLLTCAFIP